MRRKMYYSSVKDWNYLPNNLFLNDFQSSLRKNMKQNWIFTAFNKLCHMTQFIKSRLAAGLR
jgi:hypothetical protein